MPVDPPNSADGPARPRRPRAAGRQDWSSWPRYNAAAAGFRGYWYPVTWSSQVTGTPQAFTICGEKVVLIRDRGVAYALHDRCPHRGVPLSLGSRQFPGTLSCAYHGWTYRLSDGKLCAVITDGPDSPICGKVTVVHYLVAERLGMTWIYMPLNGEEPPPIDEQLPEELVTNPFVMGGRIEPSSEIRILLSLPQKDEQPVPVLVKAAVRRCTSLPEGKFELAAEFLRETDKTTSTASAKSEKA